MLLWVVAVGFEKHRHRFRQVKCQQLFQDFMVFMLVLIQGNKDSESVEDFVSLFWCKSGELGGGGSPRFSCITAKPYQYWKSSP